MFPSPARCSAHPPSPADSLPDQVVHSFNPDLTDSVLLDRRLWILASMTLLCPLAFLRRLDSLKLTSYIALCAIGYLVRPSSSPSLPCTTSADSALLDDPRAHTQIFVVVFYTFVSHEHLPPSGNFELFRFGPSFIQSLPVQIFAFTCAQNVFAVYNEVRTVRRRSSRARGTRR